MIQIVGLLVIATVGNRSPHLVCAVYLVLIALAALGAAVFMNNLTNQHTDAEPMGEVCATRDSWLISLLYIGTFGSFIGFGFAFGQVLQMNFLAGLSHGGPVTSAMAAQARCTPPRSPSSARCWGRCRVRWAAGCPIVSAAAGSRCTRSSR